MGLSSKKTKTTSVQDQAGTATTTPDVPDWLLKPAQNLAGHVGGFLDQGPDAYTPEVSGLQQGAFDSAGGLTTSPLIGEGAGAVRGAQTQFDGGTVQGQSLLDGLENYYTPYKDQILNPVLNDFDANSGKVRAAQAADGAKGAFRGSRFGVREGQTEGELARGRASTEGGLLSDMFNTSTALSGQDASRRQSAMEGNASRALTAQTAGSDAAMRQGGLLAGFGQAQGGEDRANLGVQATLGGQQTELQNKIKQFPLEYQQQLEGLFAGLDPSLFSGQTVNSTEHSTGSGTSTTTDPMGTIGKMAKVAGTVAMMSDRRLKRDIVPLGKRPDGLIVYLYRYLWSPVLHAGVMAQEVLRVKPEAVFTLAGGYLAVDYGKL